VLTARQRAHFDGLVEAVLDTLPAEIKRLLGETPLIVEDRPSAALAAELDLDPGEEMLCGLFSGPSLTDRSVEHGYEEPSTIYLFREAIVEEAGGWERWQDEQGQWWGGEPSVRTQIRITLLHEIGHHYGLEEDDLEELGYG
jgi:predicted Zn-dependent protease with MMP-like domain